MRAAINGDDHVCEIEDAARALSPPSDPGDKKSMLLKHGKPGLMT